MVQVITRIHVYFDSVSIQLNHRRSSGRLDKNAEMMQISEHQSDSPTCCERLALNQGTLLALPYSSNLNMEHLYEMTCNRVAESKFFKSLTVWWI